MLELKDVNFRLCKYRIDSIILTVPGVDPYQINTLGIADWVIEKDFDQYQYPYFRVTVGVPNNVFRAMRKNYDNIQAYVRIMYAYFKPQETVGAPGVKVRENVYLAGNFIVLMEDSSPHFTTEPEEITERQTLPKEGTPDFQNMTTVEILLYKQKDLNIIKKNPRVVYHNATLIDILTDYLRKIKLSNVLCSPPDNNMKRYPQFVLPPLRADEQILRICCDYGMHKYGTTLFFDFDKTYIINKVNKCTAWTPNEYKTIYVINPNLATQVGTTLQGCSYESADRCGYCTMVDAKASAASIEREQVFGTSFEAIDKHTGKHHEVNTNAVTVKGGGNISRVMGSYDGEVSTYHALKQRIEEESCVMTVVLDGIDLTMLEPNKQFCLTFISPKLKKYNRFYRLVRYTTSFIANDGQWFAPTVLATFVGKKPE